MSERLREQVVRAAAARLSVLLVGETGVGKDLVAREIHRLAVTSGYRSGPFVVIDCPNIPEAQAEVVLLGQAPGAFTGAEPGRKSPFELAERGTVFIDGVDELSPPVQAKLLRILEDRELTPLGSLEAVAVDVQVIAAVRGRPGAVREPGKLRADLYYRLGEYLIEIPPLRARVGDTALLAQHFLAELGTSQELSPAADHALEHRSWPGNLRELRAVVRRAARVHADVPLLGPEHLFEGQALGVERDAELGRLLDCNWENAKEEFGRWYWTNVWQRFGGDKQRVVEHTCVSQVWLRNRRRNYNLNDNPNDGDS